MTPPAVTQTLTQARLCSKQTFSAAARCKSPGSFLNESAAAPLSYARTFVASLGAEPFDQKLPEAQPKLVHCVINGMQGWTISRAAGCVLGQRHAGALQPCRASGWRAGAPGIRTTLHGALHNRWERSGVCQDLLPFSLWDRKHASLFPMQEHGFAATADMPNA